MLLVPQQDVGATDECPGQAGRSTRQPAHVRNLRLRASRSRLETIVIIHNTWHTAVAESRPQKLLEGVSPLPVHPVIVHICPAKTQANSDGVAGKCFLIPASFRDTGPSYLRSLLVPQCAWVEKFGVLLNAHQLCFLIALALAVHHQPPVLVVFPSCKATTLPPAELVRSKF